jgi:hypothetical protein
LKVWRRQWDKVTGNETREEGLAAQVLIVLLEMLLGGGDELDASELKATVLETRDDWPNQPTLSIISFFHSIELILWNRIQSTTARIQSIILT